MKKIAILRCLKSAEMCTGAACLHALSAKTAYFEPYAGEEIQLVAFFSCNGCKELQFQGTAGLEEKLQCILSLGTDIVHIGVCCTENNITCPNIVAITEFFKARQIKIVWGTHR